MRGISLFKLRAAVETTCPADANADYAVTFGDVTAVLSNFGASGNPNIPGDANGDGVVNFGDVTAVLGAFGAAC